MLLEICVQIYSVVFALSRQINKQKVCENISSTCEGNKVFVKYQAQRGGLTPPSPLRTPLSTTFRNGVMCSENCVFCKLTLQSVFAGRRCWRVDIYPRLRRILRPRSCQSIVQKGPNRKQERRLRIPFWHICNDR